VRPPPLLSNANASLPYPYEFESSEIIYWAFIINYTLNGDVLLSLTLVLIFQWREYLLGWDKLQHGTNEDIQILSVHGMVNDDGIQAAAGE
jgi:hypothetical protein